MRNARRLYAVMAISLIITMAGVAAALIGAAFGQWPVAIVGLIGAVIGFAVAIGAIMLDE